MGSLVRTARLEKSPYSRSNRTEKTATPCRVSIQFPAWLPKPGGCSYAAANAVAAAAAAVAARDAQPQPCAISVPSAAGRTQREVHQLLHIGERGTAGVLGPSKCPGPCSGPQSFAFHKERQRVGGRDRERDRWTGVRAIGPKFAFHRINHTDGSV